MERITRIEQFCEKYRGELIISVFTAILSIIITTIIAAFIPLTNSFHILIATIGLLIVFLLLAVLFNSKRLIDAKFIQINHILKDQFGYAWQENEYYRRKRHFVEEKKKLADITVREVLPYCIDKLSEDLKDIDKINIILDSGTTITPIFSNLVKYGISLSNKNIKINFFTNNLAGIDEVCKEYDPNYCKFSERAFQLIGGMPLNTYRATTGEVTQKILSAMWKEQSNKEKTISIITANWFLAHNGLDELAICARGEGHLDFKSALVQNSDFVIIVSPLTKILRLDDLKELNNMVPYIDKYKEFTVPPERKNTTLLLTTFRSQNSMSPLRQHSEELLRTFQKKHNKNFEFWHEPVFYSPQGRKRDVYEVELPHPYIENNFKEMYGYKLP